MPESWSSSSPSFLDLQQRLDELFDELIYRRWAIPGPATWQPPLDVHESHDGYLVVVDLPGVPPNRVEVRVTENEVIISGDRPETDGEGAILSHRERRCGRFRRSLALTQSIDPEQARAEYEHGTYRIWLPKKREDRPIDQPTGSREQGTARSVRIRTR